jgi:hypothetical protein
MLTLEAILESVTLDEVPKVDKVIPIIRGVSSYLPPDEDEMSVDNAASPTDRRRDEE